MLTTRALQEAAAAAVVRELAPSARLVYALGGTQKFELPTGEASVDAIFRRMEAVKRSWVAGWLLSGGWAWSSGGFGRGTVVGAGARQHAPSPRGQCPARIDSSPACSTAYAWPPTLRYLPAPPAHAGTSWSWWTGA